MARKHTDRGMSGDFGGSFLEDKLKMETFDDKLVVEQDEEQTVADTTAEKTTEQKENESIEEPTVEDSSDTEPEIDLSALPMIEKESESPKQDDNDGQSKQDDKERVRINKKTAKQNLEALIKPKKKTLGSVKMTFTVREDIPELMDSIFTDRDGKRKKGTWGLNKKIATNGIIKELVHLGLIEEDYLKELEEYD